MLEIIEMPSPLSEENLIKQVNLYNSSPQFNEIVMGKAILSVEDIKQDIAEDMKLGAKFCYVCVNGEEVGLIQYLRNNPSDNSPWLGLLLIHHDFQRNGFGSQAFALFEDMLKSYSLEKVRLCVQDGNEIAEAFWRRQGFTIIKSSADKHQNTINIFEKRWMMK